MAKPNLNSTNLSSPKESLGSDFNKNDKINKKPIQNTDAASKLLTDYMINWFLSGGYKNLPIFSGESSSSSKTFQCSLCGKHRPKSQGMYTTSRGKILKEPYVAWQYGEQGGGKKYCSFECAKEVINNQ
jgi:hypothetical protein